MDTPEAEAPSKQENRISQIYVSYAEFVLKYPLLRYFVRTELWTPLTFVAPSSLIEHLQNHGTFWLMEHSSKQNVVTPFYLYHISYQPYRFPWVASGEPGGYITLVTGVYVR